MWGLTAPCAMGVLQVDLRGPHEGEGCGGDDRLTACVVPHWCVTLHGRHCIVSIGTCGCVCGVVVVVMGDDCAS